MAEISERLEKLCHEKCQSGKYETGHGTCALICMENLGDVRARPGGCPKAISVFAHTFEAPIKRED